MLPTDHRDPMTIATTAQHPNAFRNVKLRSPTVRAAAADAELLPASPRPLVVGDERDDRGELLDELARLRAELARARGDDSPPASPEQLRFLADLLRNGVSKRDAAAMIGYLKGWPGWSKGQQSLAMQRCAAVRPQEALDALPTRNGEVSR